MSSLNTNKVVTITLNPAIDLTGQLDMIAIGAVNRPSSSVTNAGGKGINVAKVLSELGADVTVTGFLGKDNSFIFEQLFKQTGITDKFVKIEGSTRTNVKLVESNQCVSDFNFPGAVITQQSIKHFEKVLDELTTHHDYFVFSGSLPEGVSPQTCARWISQLSKQGKKVFFDSSQAALREGILANPWLIKPNLDEIEELISVDLSSIKNVVAAIEQLEIENIVLSMGEKGAIWKNGQRILRAIPPKLEVCSTVGAGDSMVSALCWGEMQHWSMEKTLKVASAISADAVTKVGVGDLDMKTLSSIEKAVSIEELTFNDTTFN